MSSEDIIAGFSEGHNMLRVDGLECTCAKHHGNRPRRDLEGFGRGVALGDAATASSKSTAVGMRWHGEGSVVGLSGAW